MSKLIFERSKKNRKAYSLPECDVEKKELKSLINEKYLRKEDAELPEVSEPELIRHYTNLSSLNFHLDKGFYPLGSCTMKYNPKINEMISRMSEFTNIHPLIDHDLAQGSLKLMYELQKILCELVGAHSMTLQPDAGAHGEFTGIKIIKKYFDSKNDNRKYIIVPDSAHGTNPATSAMVGYKCLNVPSDKNGNINIEALKEMMTEEVAGLMLTNPNTLGLFDTNIKEITSIVHNKGGLVYYDGANLNAIIGIAKPCDMGFDIVHLNLHKTFSTPHGGGGPGSGPVGVIEELAKFLPVPVVIKKDDKYDLDYNRADSIGKVSTFYGNFLIMVRAYCYLRILGKENISSVSKNAVLNANYIMESLKDVYHLPYNRTCMHEFVLSGIKQKEKGASTLDIAKRLLDLGFHAPTVYFPLIVSEALMIEPTETESIETLDEFIETMRKIAEEIDKDPEIAISSPKNTIVKRLNETDAARNPILNYRTFCNNNK